MTTASLIPWRRRTDLVVRARREDGTGGYVVKDPIALRYYQLGDEEHFVWSRLDGRQTVESLCRAFGEGFLPRQLSAEELQRFVMQLISQGLVLGEHGDTAKFVGQRAQRQHWQQVVSQSLNLLAIRFRGINPDRWLTRLLPWCAWIFSPVFLTAGVLLWLSAILLWCFHASDFLQRWPEEAAQWTVQDLGSLAVVLACVKIIHELAHALTCKRFGGHVPELGVMLLIFTPCLYCNVSDAWLLRSKWQRIVISAAGMIAEGFLAAAATWFWWASAPGAFHGFCLQVVVVCGVSTLVFNSNPLLRYDGYFMLADWLERPNLQQQASAALGRTLRAWLSGQTTAATRGITARQEQGLAAFAILSLCYRIIVVAMVLWTVYQWLEPQGYALVAQALIASTLLTLAWGMVAAIPLMVKDWRSQSPDERRTGGFRLGIVSVLLLALLFIPLPCRVSAPALIEPASAHVIHATSAGWLERVVEPGQRLATDDVVVQLRHPGGDRDLLRSEGEVSRAQARLSAIERRQLVDPQAGLQRSAAEQSLRDLKDRLRQRRAERERLEPKATQAGVYWPEAYRTASTARHRLPSWSGSLHEPRNTGCWVEAGTGLGMVADAGGFEAIAYLPQRDVTDLRVGQAVRVVLDATAGTALRGQLTELAVAETPSLDPAVALRLRLPATVTAHGHQLVGTWYRARIVLDDGSIPPVRRLVGTASIVVPPQTLWQRAARWTWTTFPHVR